MKRSTTLAVVFTILFQYMALAGDSTAVNLIGRMHTRYYKGPCKAYIFSQKNTHFRNDSVVGNSVWHEAVEFPDKFRIHFGDKAKGNFVVYKNDSVFNYKAGKLMKERADSSSLLLLLGGMFYRELNEVMIRLKHAGYDVNVLSEQSWNGRPVYVIGAKQGDLTANQVWVDKKDLNVLRILEKLNEKDMMDMRFESHQRVCRGFVETRVSFRRNGRLEQVEEYYDIKQVESFNTQ